MSVDRHHRYLFILLCFGLALILNLLLVNTMFADASNGDYALDFDGSSDWVELPTNRVVIGPTWQTTKTVSLWVRPNGTGPVGGVMRGDMIFGDFPLWFGIFQTTYSGQDRLWVVNFVSGADGIHWVGIPYTSGEWVHITLVHGWGTLFAYKNGELVGSTPTGPTANGLPTEPLVQLRIGGAIQTSWNVLSDEQIDEVQIWDRARTAAEIRRDMYRVLSGSEPGLRAYYRMSSGSGTTLTDDSANSFDGILRDGGSSVAPDGDTAAWIASGAFVGPRTTLDFDGADDYVDVGDNAATVIGAGWAGTKSADVWVNPATAGPVVASASQGDWIFGGANWGISQANISGEDRLWLWNNDGNEDRIGLTYTPGTWTPITLVHEGGMLTAYQNGLVAGSLSTGSTVGDGTLTIGGLSGGQGFQGQIDELRLWNDGRSFLEVQTHVFQTVPPDESGLMAYYRFDQENEAGQTEVVDSTSNGRHGTMTNMDPDADWLASTAFNTWVGGDSQAWSDGGNWSRYTATNANVGITRYTSSYTPTITAPTAVTNGAIVPGASLVVNDTLTVNGTFLNLGTIEATNLTVASRATLEMQSGGQLTVTGILQNSGALKQTTAVDGSGVASFFDMGGYGGMRLDPGGQNLGETAVTIGRNRSCTSIPGETAVRCFTATPQIAPAVGISLTLTFADSELYGQPCESVNLYHWNGIGWDTVTPAVRNCAPSLNFVTVENVTDLSPFALGVVTPLTFIYLPAILRP